MSAETVIPRERKRASGSTASVHVACFGALVLAVLLTPAALAQADSTRRDTTARAQGTAVTRDTSGVQNKIYSRPFIGGGGQTSIGGYAEGNTNYFVEDGVSEGFSMELRRFNIFLFSSLGPRLRFISELEFEHGTEEIALETALLDYQLDPALILRAGILLTPIGAFNQNHDSPRWEFVDRPLVSTRIIPSTLSEVGFGVYGRVPLRGATLTYDAYVTNGLGDGVVLNDEGRTLLAAGKRADAFEEDNNGSPAITGRVALQRSTLGELGLSYYKAIYNSFRSEGADVDSKRGLSIAAVDFSTALGSVALAGEVAAVGVDVPDDLREVFGARQWGAHLDAILAVWRSRRLARLGAPAAVVSVALRAEYIDYNVGKFASTGRTIRDDVVALVPGVSLRPSAGTVFKANYRRHWTRDFLGNPTARLGGYQFGLATYF